MSESLITQFLEIPLICEEYFEDSPIKYPQESWSPKQPDYINDLILQEICYIPDQYAFTRQKEITESMRSILLDWIMELCSMFYLKRETYYLAISHIDRLISSLYITRNDFQLIGISSLYLACKSEEITPPKVSDFVKAADRAYPSSSIILMEKTILKVLK